MNSAWVGVRAWRTDGSSRLLWAGEVSTWKDVHDLAKKHALPEPTHYVAWTLGTAPLRFAVGVLRTVLSLLKVIREAIGLGRIAASRQRSRTRRSRLSHRVACGVRL